MTEQEAKDKWCPFIQMAAGAGAMGWNSNRGPYGAGISGEFRCIGSACMAFRWSHTSDALKPTRVHPNVLKDHWKGWTVTDDKPDAEGYVGISPPPETQNDGFCGLAGTP